MKRKPAKHIRKIQIVRGQRNLMYTMRGLINEVGQLRVQLQDFIRRQDQR